MMTTNQRKIAVVFVAYGCVPKERLTAHFDWNNRIYWGSKATIYVVVDCVAKALPSAAFRHVDVKLLRYDAADLPTIDEVDLTVEVDGELLEIVPAIGRDGRLFSLTKTKNFGIQRALDDGADVIICTDVDIAFSPVAWDTMCEVEMGQAIMPVYHLCKNFENRHQEPSRVDHGMTGTTAMVAEHWRKIQYDERCVAYGADDGILLRDIRRAGIQLIPPRRKFPIAPVVWHVDHTLAAVDNVPGGGRPDCWGRAEGFNPDNFEANRKLHDNR